MLRVDLRVERPGLAIDARVDVEPGEIAVVYGPSGIGKSTIVRAVAGLLRPVSGTVTCGDRTWFASASAGSRTVDLRPRDRRLGLVVQEGALFPHLSAWRNVAFALDDRPRRDRRAAALDHLDRLGLAARAEARPAALSGGERQRVALARALARRPRALLLDEPFAALDREAGDRAATLVRAAVDELRIPAVVVSHDPTDVARLGGRALAVSGGRLVPADAARIATGDPGGGR